ncbi:MAG: hypothetical protein HZA93_21290 [Verrucomicrobia bacterium]|nr:hypothetical protein [Verrucomicrobiota bacterium]
MNSLHPLVRPTANLDALRPGVPFSTRLMFRAMTKRPGAVMGNRAYIRAWAARRAAGVVPSVRAK